MFFCLISCSEDENCCFRNVNDRINHVDQNRLINFALSSTDSVPKKQINRCLILFWNLRGAVEKKNRFPGISVCINNTDWSINLILINLIQLWTIKPVLNWARTKVWPEMSQIRYDIFGYSGRAEKNFKNPILGINNVYRSEART